MRINKLSWECHTRGYKLSQTLSCKLELARFSILLRIQDRDRVGKNYIGGDTAQKKHILGGGTGHRTPFLDGRTIGENNWGVVSNCIIQPLRGSILRARTCQILSMAKNPRWSSSLAIWALWLKDGLFWLKCHMHTLQRSVCLFPPC